MFQKVYVKALDSVKRGLNKSLQESGARLGYGVQRVQIHGPMLA